MARWRLTAPHYINVPGTEWEYKEVTDTGRSVKKVFDVPAYLNPDDRADHNYPGEIIVAQAPGAQPRDIIFLGPPGPDMAPLDEAAQALSDAESHKWVHPIEALDGTIVGQNDGIGNALRDIAAIAASMQPGSMVPKGEFDELKEMVQALAAQNAALQAELTKPGRRA